MPINGKDFYLGPHNSVTGRGAYDLLIAEWLANGRQLPGAVECGARSVAELLIAYLHFARAHYCCDGESTREFTCLKDAIPPLRELYSTAAVRDSRPLEMPPFLVTDNRPSYVARRFPSDSLPSSLLPPLLQPRVDEERRTEDVSH